MNALSHLAARALRGVVRLVTLILLASVVLGLLLLGIVAALFSVLWSLLRGRRPAMFTVLRSFQQASRQFRRAPWASQATKQDRASDSGDVVDVQAHEVRAALGERTQR